MKNIEELLGKQKQKTLLAIFAHPDDETMACGMLLYTAKKMGYKTIVAILTGGEAGQMHIHPNGKTIRQIRKAELEGACLVLDVDQLTVDDFSDGKLRLNPASWYKKVREIIKANNPSIVTTFDHSGITGHPDHIILSLKLKKLIFQEFAHISLLWPTIPEHLAAHLVNPEVVKYLAKPEYRLENTSAWEKKCQAAHCYESQRFATPAYPSLTEILGAMRHEWYHLADKTQVYNHKFVPFDI